MRVEVIALLVLIVVIIIVVLFNDRRSECSVPHDVQVQQKSPVSGTTSKSGVCPVSGATSKSGVCPVSGATSKSGVCPVSGAKSTPEKSSVRSKLKSLVTGGWVSRLGNYMSEYIAKNSKNSVKNRILARSGIFQIRQSHFNDGTFRIKTPGTYHLKEDILFNPPTGSDSTRADTPLNGFWFAGLSVEADNVIIDGRGHTIEIAAEYMQTVNVIGSFVAILLGNNQFSGPLFGGGEATFPDTSVYVPSNFVKIKNIKIVGKGTHFGIMGNNCKNISITCSEISDCQVSNVYMQSVQGLRMSRNILRGSVTPLTINQDVTQLFYMRKRFREFVEGGVPNAQVQWDNLEAYVSSNPDRFNPAAQRYPSTALYGLFIVPSPTTFFEFPVGSLESTIGSGFTDSFLNGGFNKEVVVENCQFLDFITEFNEMVGIGTNANEPSNPVFPLQGWILLTFGLFGAIQWKDAFDSTGTFNPNDFLKSLVFIMNTIWPMLGPLQGIYPTNSVTIFESILNSDANTFYANASPLHSLQSDGTFAKGLFGIRAIAIDGGSLKNLKFDNVSAIGPPPIDPVTLPGYQNVTMPQPLIRSRANDAWHVSLEFCNNVIASDIKMQNLFSKHGYTFAYHFAGENSNCAVTFSESENQSAPNTVVNSVTDTGDSFCFTVEDNTGIITLGNLETKNISAAGTVEHFATASNLHPTEIIVANCQAI
jgi:hypothetical protein